MIESTLSQPFLFAACIYFGMLIGVLYSAVHFLQHLFGNKKWVVAGLDIAFVLASGAGVICFLFFVLNVTVRFYHVAGFALGMAFYFLAIYPLIKIIKCKIHRVRVDKKEKNQSNKNKD